MAHPFDVERVKTGQDLIDFINDAVVRLQNQEIAGSVKWDGINTSFKLITGEGGQKEFRMDRGTNHTDSVIGLDAAAALDKWGAEHGMANAVATLLKIFNAAIPQIEPELKELGMWDTPTKYFNTEYIEGKSNVQEYDQNILAIHGINQFYEKKAQPHAIRKGTSMDRPGLERPLDPNTGKPTKAGGIEIPYNKDALASLIEKVQPVATEYGFEIYGDVPVEFDPEVELDLDKILDTPISVQITPGGVATNSLREWLQMVEHPQDKKVTRADGKSVGALSKDVYLAVLQSAEDNGTPLSQYLESQDDVKDAINGGIFYHGTRLLGQAVKNALRSKAGSVGDHEGVVLRGMEDFLVKLTGDFIVQGLASTHGDKSKQSLAEGALSNTALYPGKFKPPHGGHFNVAKQVLQHPEVNKLIIFVSPKVHEGITPEQAADIWNIYRNYLPGDIDIRIADVTPVRGVYDYIDNEAESGEDLHLILGEKDIEGGRFKTAAERREDVNVAEVPIPPQMGGVSATQMRRALRDNEDATFIAGLPKELNDADLDAIMTVLGATLDEMSGVGAAAGYSLPLGAKMRHPEMAGSEKRKKRHPKDFLKEERLVSEVADYLLGITVG
tara:strand:- start:9872 stop:11710 length:1839 start_codon:yes stop_codon:yes gene_type:complete